jgi:hypothetical protein
MTAELVDACLQSGEYVDSASPAIAAFAARVCGDARDDLTRAVRLYYAVRDEIVYTPRIGTISATSAAHSAPTAPSSSWASMMSTPTASAGCFGVGSAWSTSATPFVACGPATPAAGSS